MDYPPGTMVEYHSASMNNWIPARVVRAGRVHGTIDLDCKEAVDLSRVRLPAAAAAAAAPAVAPTCPRLGAGPATAAGPLGLQAGDCCFYKSSTHGWISAAAVRYRPDENTYDLDVKQQVGIDKIKTIADGTLVEYLSTSTNQWIPAKVIRKGQNGNFDLDCKAGVHISRLRIPAGSGGSAAPVIPDTMPQGLQSGGYRGASANSTYTGGMRDAHHSERLGLGTPPVTVPELLAVPAKVVQVAAGEAHALLLALAPEPRVYCTGANDFGQLGLGDTLERPSSRKPLELQALPPGSLVAGLACGGQVSFAVSQRGDVWSWGRNEDSGVLGQGSLPVTCVPSPVPVAGLKRKVRAAQLATTGWTGFCVSHLGSLYSWGGGLCGAHGHGHQVDEAWPKLLRGLEGAAVVQAAAGQLHALALSGKGEVFTWGRISGAFGAEVQLQMWPKLIDALVGIEIVQVAAGGQHSLALAAGGEVYAWGAHTSGALGSPDITNASRQHALVHPAELGCLGPVRELACGRCHSLFLAAAEGPAGRPGDLWLCGMGAAPAPAHVAAQAEGAAAGGEAAVAKALAPPSGTPLKLQRMDVKRMLEILS